MGYSVLFIPVLAILGGLTIAIIALVTDHKQKILIIERGVDNLGYSSPGLRSGLTFSFLGVAFIYFFNDYEKLGGLLMVFGLSQLIYFLVERKERKLLHKKFIGHNPTHLSN
ncbi:MAG: hypothetical protein ACOYVD_07645 [Bacillota bacterium]